MSDSDKFYSINPAFLAVMKAMKTQAPGADPEFLLASNFFAPILSKVIEGMQTESFLTQLRIIKFPGIMTQVQSGIVSALVPVVQGGVALQVIG